MDRAELGADNMHVLVIFQGVRSVPGPVWNPGELLCLSLSGLFSFSLASLIRFALSFLDPPTHTKEIYKYSQIHGWLS